MPRMDIYVLAGLSGILIMWIDKTSLLWCNIYKNGGEQSDIFHTWMDI